jgi:hypothetical protein
MTGHALINVDHRSQTVPFKVFFKAIFGFALAAILVVGAAFIFVNDDIAARLMLPLQSIAGVIAGIVGLVSARRAGKDAPSSD